MFLDAQPTSSEAEVYDVVKAVLDQSTQILEDLNDYQGANEPIRVVCIYTDSNNKLFLISLDERCNFLITFK